ncbi:phosphotransferase family protein [Microcoleus sp. OTE_8_concoct_300]|uniref:phosphotransferase family protein n=1 Tax=Microcoleus sp. OTE_8_concoct_300 TaxID=2964710 RepID=UPI00403F6A33
MALLLSSHNVTSYLRGLALCTDADEDLVQIDSIPAKNFNLLVTLSSGHKYLVKQERYASDGKTAGEFLNEWRIQEFLQQFPELENFRALLPVVLHFDRENSIMVSQYLDDYRDLADFYAKENVFPSAIASSIGTLIATIHRSTYNRPQYREFFYKTNTLPINRVKYVTNKLERVEPEIFGMVPPEVLKFISLYQRYDSLGQAMAELSTAFNPCCLTHNDLKVNNILLHVDSHKSSEKIVRLIDWERANWGDPAFDLGILINTYLVIWLNSLVISNSLTIEESLRLATIPLEKIQPSIAALTCTYFDNFPEILEHRPDFLLRVVQFTGFGLIQQVLSMMQNQASLGNTGIAILQVAKSLLCRPEQSMQTIFGSGTVELSRFSFSAS